MEHALPRSITDGLHRQDCSTIANTRATGCEKGVCTVFSCMPGYTVSGDKRECVRASDAGQAVFQQRR